MRGIAFLTALVIAGCYGSSGPVMPEYQPEECTTHVTDLEPGDLTAGLAGSTWMLVGALPWDADSFIMVMSLETEGGPVEPGTTEIPDYVPMESCSLCILVNETCDGPGCPRMYVVRRAVFQIYEIDLRVGGRLRATLTEAQIVEWDDDVDAPVPEGNSICIDTWEIDEIFTEG